MWTMECAHVVWDGMCTCSLGWNVQPTGEPCRRQAAVARKYKINGLNVIPTFNVDGRFLFAQIAVRKDAGPLSFYSSLHDLRINTHNSTSKNDEQSSLESDKLSQTDYNEGAANLDLLIDEWRKLLIRLQHNMRGSQQM